MQIGVIRGHRMTDMESKLSVIYESDRAFQKLMDDLGEIENARLLTKEEINSFPEYDKKNGRRVYKANERYGVLNVTWIIQK